ncbi:MAG: hypothetical protein V7704_11985 [Aurantimonas endophytica]|uniref:hypothetical protein n=1 Tax=Aurantimonas endophytica TaxID=1522175 RepID=UPI0030022281
MIACRTRLLGAAFLLASSSFCCLSASAQELLIDADPPRRVGWFVGDRLDWSGHVTIPEGLELDSASLPEPGPLDSFTEISSITVSREAESDATRYDFHVVYQSFYVPLEPREITIPPLNIGFRATAENDPTRRDIAFPAWPVVLSPLRPILERSSMEAMRPDKLLTVIDTTRRQGVVAASWAAFAILVAAFGWHRGWGPARYRRSRPLARAWRDISRAQLAEVQGYEAALLRLHRGLDEAFGHRILADDLDRHLLGRPAFGDVSGDLHRFFAASRAHFFAGRTGAAASILPGNLLRELARRLSAIERGSR